MTDFGIKASRDGTDLFGSPALSHISFTSQYPTLKIDRAKNPVHVDYFEHTYASNPPVGQTTILTFSHGYDFIPATFAYISLDGVAYYTLPNVAIYNAFQTDILEWYAETSATTFSIILNKEDSFGLTPNINGDTHYFKYMIFALEIETS